MCIVFRYSIFGELFDDAIRAGLPAIQTQHPGFYYQQAAQCATQRRQACRVLCAAAGTYPQPDPLQGQSLQITTFYFQQLCIVLWRLIFNKTFFGGTIEFYGQRVWRPGKLSADPPDPQREKDAILALQYIELHHVNHSVIISTIHVIMLLL